MKAHNISTDCRVAIVGCGRMACKHAEKLVKNTNLKNLALCDAQILKTQVLSDMFGINAIYDSLDAMLEDFKPDICHVVTPPGTHKALAIRCMEAGSHVYIEKPVCLNLAEFDEIAETARRCKRYFCTGHQRLHERQYKNIKDLLESGKLGRIIHITAYDSAPYLALEDQGLFSPYSAGFAGGMFLDLLPHMLSVFNDIAPGLKCGHAHVCKDKCGRPAEMYALYASDASPVASTVRISFSTQFVQQYYRIECEKGVAFLNLRNRFTVIQKKGRAPEILDRLTRDFVFAAKTAWGNAWSIAKMVSGRMDPYEGVGRLIRDFHRAAMGGEPLPMSVESMREVVRLADETIGMSFGPDLAAPGAPKRTAVASETADDSVNEQSPADVLVTGATGFIGKHLVTKLLKNGKTVRIISRKPVAQDYFGESLGGMLQVCHGDITDYALLKRATKNIQCVYHLAAATRGDIFTNVEVTGGGTRALLKAFEENNVPRLVYVSSVAILDQTKFPKSGSVNDDFPLESQPLKRGAYTYGKLCAERMVLDLQRSLPKRITVIRPGTVWGPGKEQTLLDTNIKIGDNNYVVFGKRSKRLPLVYVENLVDALILSGESPESVDAVFNVVDKANPTQGEYLDLLSRMTGKKQRSLFIPVSLIIPVALVAEKVLGFMLKQKLHISYQFRSKNNRAEYSTDKIAARLGWKSSVSFVDGLKKTGA